MTPGQLSGYPIHLDHVHPVALGGATTLSNLQLAHSVCNMRKGARLK